MLQYIIVITVGQKIKIKTIFTAILIYFGV